MTTAPRLRAPARVALLVAVALLSTACAGYGKHRLLDVTDVLDTKFACGWDSVGLGAKVELTDYFGVGAGFGRHEQVRESYGRWERTFDQDFVHLVFFGIDGPPFMDGPRPGTAVHSLGINCCQESRAPVIDRFRFGAEVLLLNIDAGLYLNLGEVVDLLVGLVGFDPAGDDPRYWDAALDLDDLGAADEALRLSTDDWRP